MRKYRFFILFIFISEFISINGNTEVVRNNYSIKTSYYNVLRFKLNKVEFDSNYIDEVNGFIRALNKSNEKLRVRLSICIYDEEYKLNKNLGKQRLQYFRKILKKNLNRKHKVLFDWHNYINEPPNSEKSITGVNYNLSYL